VVPKYPPDDPRSYPQTTTEGSPGKYKVTCAPAIPGKNHFQDSLNFPQIMGSGESLLWMGKDARESVIDLHNGIKPVPITFSPDQNGSLSQIQLTFDAANFDSAFRIAYDAISPLLSRLSFVYNIAIDIKAYEVEEQKTKTRMWWVAVLGTKITTNPKTLVQTNISDQLGPILAAYREAMNTTNVFYQVLCYYKVIHACQSLKGVRLRESSQAREQDEPSEQFPDDIKDIPLDDSTHAPHFRPFLGKKFGWVRDQYRGLLRNAIAHLDPQQVSLCSDRLDDVSACLKAIPVLRYMARQLLGVEMAGHNNRSGNQ
jgi:hypothetical protein